VDNVRLQERFSSRRPAEGTLYLTATHLIFVESPTKTRKETWILHNHIASVEKLPTTTLGCPLLIICKNFHVATFVMSRERDCHDIHTSLLRLSRPALYEELYAFSYNPQRCEEDRASGWRLLSPTEDFARMGLPNALWDRTDVNRDFRVCETYPCELYVPRSVSSAVILGSAKFRSKGRVPVLSYYHSETGAALCRCSQPLSGFNARCLEDEQLLHAVRRANADSVHLYVVDTRPK
ncbi:phosphatidylinositol-3,5-bisphosphate 3-phosphatase MTMR8-like, partial [Lampetra fluviatilis]